MSSPIHYPLPVHSSYFMHSLCESFVVIAVRYYPLLNITDLVTKRWRTPPKFKHIFWLWCKFRFKKKPDGIQSIAKLNSYWRNAINFMTNLIYMHPTRVKCTVFIQRFSLLFQLNNSFFYSSSEIFVRFILRSVAYL